MSSRAIIAVLIGIIVVGGGWYFYQESQKDTVTIELDENGISITED